jgi:hypothetical protein
MNTYSIEMSRNRIDRIRNKNYKSLSVGYLVPGELSALCIMHY